MIVSIQAHCVDAFNMTTDKEPDLCYEGYVPDVLTGKHYSSDDLCIKIDTETMKIVNISLPKSFSLLDIKGGQVFNEKTNEWIRK